MDAQVGIIGGGLSGVLMGMQFRRRGFDDFVIYDKQPDVGGTWLRNTYPGLHCDVPSHLYCYSFEPNPDWSRVYSPQAEIQKYVEHCVDKYELRPHIVHGAKVRELRLDEAQPLVDVLDKLVAARMVKHIGLHDRRIHTLQVHEVVQILQRASPAIGTTLRPSDAKLASSDVNCIDVLPASSVTTPIVLARSGIFEIAIPPSSVSCPSALCANAETLANKTR